MTRRTRLRECRMLLLRVVPAVLIAASVSLGSEPEHGSIPRLQKVKQATHLIVDGKPFLMLAGELNNSSASSLEYMKWIWPRLAKMHLNTAVIPVYWELMEPVRGRFDFRLVDGAIASARAHHMKIVFLWFGTWKNSMSCYVPEWMKKDTVTFPRSRSAAGEPQEIVTPFSRAALEADCAAFAAFMKHLGMIDRKERTVVMVQVENEIGMLPDARDHAPEAERAFASPVPSELTDYLRTHASALEPDVLEAWKKAGMKMSGSWEEVFGPGVQTEEFFMAWSFARYVDAVALSGKREYPLPMYVNAALTKPGQKPGQYPSAGPLPHLMNFWKAGAPSIDMLSPDIYQKTFASWIARFDRPDNPLFIPEVDKAQSAANAFYAFGAHKALGYSPYAIEYLDDPGAARLAEAYAMLNEMTPLVVGGQEDGTLFGVLLDSTSQTSRIPIGEYILTVKHEYTWPYASRKEGSVPRVGGMIIMHAPDEFTIAATGIVITFEPRNRPGTHAGILRSDEGVFTRGTWAPRRRMNGDETHQGRHIHCSGDAFSIQRVKLYTY